MSLQWTAVAGFLYVEIALTILLILPLLKPSVWKWIFNRNIFSAIRPVWTTIYYSVLLVLVVLFIDSIRIMRKYGHELSDQSTSSLTLDAKLDRRLHECRGQRNFYITGFALFLILVIKRLITMLSMVATLEASHSATLRQAQAANAELARRIERESSEAPTDGTSDTKTKSVGPSKEEYKEMEDELKKTKADLAAMKKQAEATNTEYDRLAEEHQKLVKGLDSGKESKKDL